MAAKLLPLVCIRSWERGRLSAPPRYPSMPSYPKGVVGDEEKCIEGSEAKALFSVTGMTCSACAASVEKAVKRLPGIKDAAVDVLNHRSQVIFCPAFVNKAAADIVEEEEGGGGGKQRRRRQAALWKKKAAAADIVEEEEGGGKQQRRRQAALWKKKKAAADIVEEEEGGGKQRRRWQAALWKKKKATSAAMEGSGGGGNRAAPEEQFNKSLASIKSRRRECFKFVTKRGDLLQHFKRQASLRRHPIRKPSMD